VDTKANELIDYHSTAESVIVMNNLGITILQLGAA
jgi:hypothetical protein